MIIVYEGTEQILILKLGYVELTGFSLFTCIKKLNKILLMSKNKREKEAL